MDTSDKLAEIWEADFLERRKDADLIIRFMNARMAERSARREKSAYVLNLDARWGDGKTFFLSRLRRQLAEAEGKLVVYVNSWETDNADDPLIPVLAAIDEVLREHLETKPKLRELWIIARDSAAKVAISSVAHLAKTGVRLLIGNGTNIIAEAVARGAGQLSDRLAEDSFAAFQSAEESKRSFKKNLSELLNGIGAEKLPLYILIDELDRCRPTYAIELLERIKHLFSIENIVFILATDTQQLRHSIKAIYGQDFDSTKYLSRFFDRRYVFEEPEVSQFVPMLNHEYLISEKICEVPSGNIKAFMVAAFTHFDLSLRDAHQCWDMLQSCIDSWKYNSKLQLIYLVPLVIAFQQRSDELFNVLAMRQTSSFPNILPRANPDWSFELRPVPNHRHEVRQSFSTVLSDFLSVVTVGYPDCIERFSSSSQPAVIWALEVLREEFTSLRAQNYSQSRAQGTVISSYPSLVRNAGRMLPIIVEQE